MGVTQEELLLFYYIYFHVVEVLFIVKARCKSASFVLCDKGAARDAAIAFVGGKVGFSNKLIVRQWPV